MPPIIQHPEGAAAEAVHGAEPVTADEYGADDQISQEGQEQGLIDQVPGLLRNFEKY